MKEVEQLETSMHANEQLVFSSPSMKALALLLSEATTAPDPERQRVMTVFLERVFACERDEAREIRDALRFAYWHGLAQVDLGRASGQEFILWMLPIVLRFCIPSIEEVREVTEEDRRVYGAITLNTYIPGIDPIAQTLRSAYREFAEEFPRQ